MMLPLLAAIRVARPRGRPRTRPERVLADKAYSSRAIRAHLRARGIAIVIPEPSTQIQNRSRRGSAGGRPVSYDKTAYKAGNAVERAFNTIKHWRGLATRYDKHAIICRGAVCRSARRCGVVAGSYFLVTFAPSRTLETSFCCGFSAMDAAIVIGISGRTVREAVDRRHLRGVECGPGKGTWSINADDAVRYRESRRGRGGRWPAVFTPQMGSGQVALMVRRAHAGREARVAFGARNLRPAPGRGW
jgi:transposase